MAGFRRLHSATFRGVAATENEVVELGFKLSKTVTLNMEQSTSLQFKNGLAAKGSMKVYVSLEEGKVGVVLLVMTSPPDRDDDGSDRSLSTEYGCLLPR